MAQEQRLSEAYCSTLEGHFGGKRLQKINYTSRVGHALGMSTTLVQYR